MTKSFTPTEMHHSPAKVYRAAVKDGSVEIKHERHPDVLFVLTAVDKTTLQTEETELSPVSKFIKEAYSEIYVDHHAPGNTPPKGTSAAISKKLLREVNEAYNKQQKELVEQIDISAPKIWPDINDEQRKLSFSRDGVKIAD